MTIRAKLLAAIVLTVLSPVVMLALALVAFDTLGDRFDDVQTSAARQGEALELKFAITDMNGWQTAYGYDGGRSRQRFESTAQDTGEQLARARTTLGSPREQAILDELERAFDSFMTLDREAYAALRDGREAVTRRILLGPEIRYFEAMARAADALADEQARRAAAAAAEFDAARATARRELVTVGIGAGVVILLLLVTVQDVVRLALERRSE